jgi:serine phosphatase RsbU (regulator of sigma subunit)
MRHVVELLRSTDRQAIVDLTAKNRELQAAYANLQAAQAKIVENERLERELEIAASVQRSLLPAELPHFLGYALAAYLRPARQVGGDFYDVLALDEDHAALVLADVADKSVQAALFMAVARTLFTVEAKRSLQPEEVALAVHRGVFELAPSADLFVTAFYGVLELQQRKLRYVCAGHERPFLVRTGRPAIQIEGRGRFLGMIPALRLTPYEVTLEPGDRVVIFSDGVTDSMNHGEEQYGYERLSNCLQRSAHMPVQKMVDALVADLASWSGSSPAFDDVTVLALQVM